MLGSEAERDTAAERIAHDVDLLITELLHEHGEIVAHVDQADVAIAEIGAPVAVQVDADYFAVPRERLQVRTEHLDLAEAAVKQQ